MHRFTLGVFAAAILTGATFALAGAGDQQSITFPMRAENGSILNGMATITADKNDPSSLTVSIVYKDVMFIPENIYPAHIHKGTCDRLDPKPAYPLKSMMTGRSTTDLKGVTLAELLKHSYSINVHSPTDIAKYVSCGEIALPEKETSKNGY
jgi:hypothetical protein